MAALTLDQYLLRVPVYALVKQSMLNPRPRAIPENVESQLVSTKVSRVHPWLTRLAAFIAFSLIRR